MSTPRYRETSTSSTTNTVSLTYTTVKQSSTVNYNPVTQSTTVSTQNYQQVIPGSSKSIVDRVTPNFRKLMKSGKIINNPLSITEERESNPLSLASVCRTQWYKMRNVPNGGSIDYLPYKVETWNGYIPAYLLLAGSGLDYLPIDASFDYDVIKAKAVTKAWARVNESDMLVLASVAESGKTARDLHLLARKVLRAIKFIRHPTPPKGLSLKKLKKYYSEAEELYMQARYNLRPLYYDILGATKIAQGESDSRRARRSSRDRYTITATVTEEETQSDSKVYPSSYLPVNLRASRYSTEAAEARAGVLCQAREMTKWEQSGLYLLPETAWELTPFSFILDWFGNFGEVISSWAPKPGVTTLTSWVTLKTTVTQQVAIAYESSNNSYPHSSSLGQMWEMLTDATLVPVTLEKVTSQTIRTPNPGRELAPSWDIDLSPFKIIDLAVIGKNLSRGIKSYRS